jgi:hypothetical protein
MLPRDRFRSGRSLTALLFTVCALAAPLAALAQEDEAAGEPNALGRELLERFEIRTEDDVLVLDPKAEDSAVRSIEIEDDEVVVNGKRFDEEELAGFLGRDGELVRDLLELDESERLAALGFPEIRRRGRRGGEVDISVPIGVPGPRIHVRPSGDERVSIGRSIHLEKGETASNVVCIGCSVVIDGHDTGDAVAIGGSVRVTGTVEGNAVSVGSSVQVGDGAVVEGDAVSVGSGVHTSGSGEVRGETVGVGVGGDIFDGVGLPPWGMFTDAGKLASAVIKTGLLALLSVLALLIARPAVDVAARRAGSEPWKAAFAGLLAQLLFGPVLILVIVVLAISIIGIPLLVLVPFAILALLLGWFVGFVAVARSLGNWVEQRFGWHVPSPALAVVVGVVLIQGTSLVGRALALPGGWIGAFGVSILALGFFLKYVAWTIGLGAMTLVALSGDWRRPSTMFSSPSSPSSPSEPLPPPVDEETAAGTPVADSVEALPPRDDDRTV